MSNNTFDDDKGHIVVLDTRLFSRSEEFISLPGMLRYRRSQDDVIKILENWAKNRERKGYTPRRNLYEVFPGNAENIIIEKII